jgi:acyl carrier protein
MNKQELTFEEFQEIIVEILGVKKDIITKDAVIYQEIGIDSLGLVNLGTKIQQKYDIEIPPAVIVEIRTIGEFYNKVRQLVESRVA